MVLICGGQQQYPSQSMHTESEEEDLRDYLQRIESLYEYNSNMLESVRCGVYLCSEYTAIPLEDSMLFIDDDDVFEEDSVLIKHASVVLVSPTIAPSGGTITKQVKAFNRHSLQQTYSKKVKSISTNSTVANVVVY